MRFYHTKCGGEIDLKARKCRRCKKKWSPISIKFDPFGIRPMLDEKGRPLPDKYRKQEKQPEGVLPSWMAALGTPLLVKFVGKLPKWPRWARILTTVIIITAVILIIYLVRR